MQRWIFRSAIWPVGDQRQPGSVVGLGRQAMSLFNTIVPPNSTEYVFNHCRYICGACFLLDADHSDIVNASSYHPGGANAVFCDGGVRFIRGSMAMRTWWAIGTAARATWSTLIAFDWAGGFASPQVVLLDLGIETGDDPGDSDQSSQAIDPALFRQAYPRAQ